MDAEHLQKLELALARSRGAAIGEIDDLALAGAVDGAVRLLDEGGEAFREPMIAARLPLAVVHALLHHHPFAVIGDDEAMQIEVEAVLHRGAVDLRHQPAGRRQGRPVEADALSDGDKLLRGPARMLAASAADVDAELGRERLKTPF